MKNKFKCIFILLAIGILIFISSVFNNKRVNSTINREISQIDTVFKTDTIIKYDTLIIKEPKPYYIEVIRSDTIHVNDTLYIALPIERKEYVDDAYRAVIEGYKPQLISIDLYKETILIRDTFQIKTTVTKYKKPRWVISAGVGVGYTSKGLQPYIGIQAGYVLWSK